ncbi:MAG TPA: ABC transporter ATP-binding protein [Candidatus Coproplasma excrementigallinarum]|uniref:ABC transporter ATP-binding protein n=1 Tax=Candidatus Coproplasma excrementigallinarum TaxID=2840747 RepID=A0A9D1ML26_9FIRM|nr:ABC transporter ATP-binding protein [Candidatus Coproplasma excrementigallinarum]
MPSTAKFIHRRTRRDTTLQTKKKGVLRRLLKTVYSFYPVLMPVAIACISLTAIVGAVPAIFMQRVIENITKALEGALTWEQVKGPILTDVYILIAMYVVSILTGTAFGQLMAVITQGTLEKLREKMFNGMQKLPIRFFDTTSHGDIMSYYTNDIDTLRQLISQSCPQILISGITVLSVFIIMLYYCLWLTLVVLAGTAIMLLVTKRIGGGSARYFVKQQKVIGEEEGYIEEMLTGQKVIKTFCHEEAAEKGFDEVNGRLYEASRRANRYANMLAPALFNIGNVLYVVLAIIGGVFVTFNVLNVSFSGIGMGVSIVVPFLNMAKQFTGNINQVSQQVNSVVMGLAGTARVFDLIDRPPEVDDGYVTLVRAKEVDGNIVETQERTGMWAWKHPHQADGSVTYSKLEGDVRMFDVDFEYDEGKPVLHNISLYAKPGQKVAFVGATGAGKTTITNLLNRFYDIADGKIRYDGININKIKKADLRHSLGMVLQDTNLFTGTVMENIRYGRLDASDEECIAAAKLAGADDFINRLPEGYNTSISGNGANLSQGQRQLLSIARVAVADPPVMILDEATSSIDTRTEAIVQRGMDALMKGRTVFVIAHRLSTVKNSDVIIVLDHGRIIERGTHEQLLEQKGQYYQLYTGAFELE